MNSVRLLKVADHLETINRKDFDLCSNEYCALGHASRLPYFKRIGLKYDSTNDVFTFKGAMSNVAIGNVFEISEIQTEYLFCGNGRCTIHKSKNSTPKQVAKAIRKFVKDY